MVTLYNKTEETLGAMIGGRHVVLPGTAKGSIGSAQVTPKQAKQAAKFWKDKVTLDYSKIKSKDNPAAVLAQENEKFKEGIKQLAEGNTQLHKEVENLKEKLKKKEEEVKAILTQNNDKKDDKEVNDAGRNDNK